MHLVRVSSWMMAAFLLVCSHGNPSKAQEPSGAHDASNRINTSGWSDSPFISRDGRYLYFMYAPYNFFPAFSGNMPVKQGPERPGHQSTTSGNPFEDSDIYVSQRLANGTWGPPQNLGMNTDAADCCAMVIDGPPRKIYYQTSSADQANQLVYRVQQADGRWGPMQYLSEINTKANEENPHISPDETGIWFTSDREGGAGGRDLWFFHEGKRTMEHAR